MNSNPNVEKSKNMMKSELISTQQFTIKIMMIFFILEKKHKENNMMQLEFPRNDETGISKYIE